MSPGPAPLVPEPLGASVQHAEGGTRVRHSPDSGPGGQGLEPAFGGTPASLGREPALCQARRHGPDPDLCGGRPTSRWSRDAGPDPAPPARSRPQPAFLLSATTPPVLTQTPAHCLGLPDPRALSLPFSSWGLTECLVGAGSVSPSCHIPFTLSGLRSQKAGAYRAVSGSDAFLKLLRRADLCSFCPACRGRRDGPSVTPGVGHSGNRPCCRELEVQLQGRRHPGSWWHIPPPTRSSR